MAISRAPVSLALIGILPERKRTMKDKTTIKKRRGGRPPLGEAKRIQQSTTYRPDLHALIYKEIEKYAEKGIVYSFSDIVEKALQRRYAPQLEKGKN